MVGLLVDCSENVRSLFYPQLQFSYPADVLVPTLSLTPCSGWLAAIGFFQTSVGAAVVMLLPAIMFTMSAAMMAVVIMKVSPLGTEMSGFFPCILSPNPPGPGNSTYPRFRSKRQCLGIDVISISREVPLRVWTLNCSCQDPTCPAYSGLPRRKGLGKWHSVGF